MMLWILFRELMSNTNFKEFTSTLLPRFRAAMQKHGKIMIASTMSGTSTDAVDVGLFEFTEAGINLKHAHTVKYSEEDKSFIKNAEIAFQKAYAAHPTGNKETLIQHARKYYDIDKATQLSEQYHIRAIEELFAKIPAEERVKIIISYHGQTSFHKPPITVQIGDPQVLANAFGCRVIGDHRINDVVNGGQGAPFAPLYHFMLYKLGLFGVSEQEPCVAVNCGGIANIALLNPDSYFGFDTGPGAGLIQKFLSHYHQEQQDTDGCYAAQGRVNDTLLQTLFEKSVIQDGSNYFDKPPPKSLDFHDLQLIPELDNLSKQDVCATLAAFTAESIVRETEKLFLPSTWILTGGGWHNSAIVAELKNRLLARGVPSLKILRENDLGLDYIECGIFAFSALFRMLGWPFTFPETTSAFMPVMAGKIYYPK